MDKLDLIRDYIDHLEKKKIEELPSDDYLAGYTLGYFRGIIETKNALQEIYAGFRGFSSWIDLRINEMGDDNQS